MIRGVGVDIVRIERFRPWVKQGKKLARFFHPREIEVCLSKERPAESLAARYAAREAFAKAIGSGLRGIRFDDMWVEQDEQGRPFLRLKGAAEKNFAESGAGSIHLSLSHEEDYAIAFVVIE